MKTNKLFAINFNNRTIYYFEADGEYWLPIKPICIALGLNGMRQIQTIKKDRVLSQLYTEQYTVGADNKRRKMVCLPEKFIYGWLFRIKITNTMKPETIALLQEHQLKCYIVLYNHFRGLLTRRKAVLSRKINRNRKLQSLEKELSLNKTYQEFIKLKEEEKEDNRALRNIDREIVSDQLVLEFKDEKAIT